MTWQELEETRERHAKSETLTPTEMLLYEIAIHLAGIEYEISNLTEVLGQVDERLVKQWKSAESCGVATAKR